MATMEQKVAMLELQMESLFIALKAVTNQVTQCAYCGKSFTLDSEKEYEVNTNFVVHASCLLSKQLNS